MSPSFAVIWACSVSPVVNKFPLTSSTIAPVAIKAPLKAAKSSADPPVAKPETIAISEVRVCPVVIKFVVNVEMSPSLAVI